MTATKFNALLDMSCRRAMRQDPFTWGSFWMLISTAATFDRLKTRHLVQYVLPTRSYRSRAKQLVIAVAILLTEGILLLS